jgi:hypothetical protein
MDCMIMDRNGCLSTETARDHERTGQEDGNSAELGDVACRRSQGTWAGVEGRGHGWGGEVEDAGWGGGAEG